MLAEEKSQKSQNATSINEDSQESNSESSFRSSIVSKSSDGGSSLKAEHKYQSCDLDSKGETVKLRKG